MILFFKLIFGKKEMSSIPIENALMVAQRVQQLGVDIESQRKIGLFAVSWGLFESHLEQAVWSILKEDVQGKRPSTDKTSAHRWLEVLEKGRADLSVKANMVLCFAAQGARDLMGYRHSLFHGYIVPLGGTAMFIRNPQWNGEIRNREVGDAYIDESIIDLAIDASWVLFSVVRYVVKLAELTVEEVSASIETLESEVIRIKSTTNELRHMRSLMNCEKY